jgi:hypothetical protein
MCLQPTRPSKESWYRTWTTTEFLDIVSAESKFLPDEQRNIMSIIHRVIARILEGQGIDDQKASSRRQIVDDSVPGPSLDQYVKGYNQYFERCKFTPFPGMASLTNACISNVNHTLVSIDSPVRMKEALSKTNSLSIPDFATYILKIPF